MRFTRLLCFLLLIPYSLSAQSDEFNLKNAGDYNNYIIIQMSDIVQKNFEYIAFSVHSEDFDQLESKRKEVLRQIAQAKDSLTRMPALEGDTRLRDGAIDVLDKYQRAFDLDYKDVIGLKRKSRDSFESMETYFNAEDQAEEKVNKATLELRKLQQSFATKHNMTLAVSSDSVLQLKMKKIVAVNSYWRVLFLDYFKVSREYDKMWDALHDKKASVIDRNRVQTLKVIGEVLPELKKIPNFNGDVEFRDQTISIMEYFQTICSDSFKQIVTLLEKKQLEQKDIDTINAIISQCNNDHELLIYNWNNASRDLFRKNVDKD